MSAAHDHDHICLVIASAVDVAFYNSVYPEVAQAGRGAVSDYAETGWAEGRDPSPWFSTEAYLQEHPDVAEAGLNPLYHYLQAGRLEGRRVVPSSFAGTYVRPSQPAPSIPPAPVAYRPPSGARASLAVGPTAVSHDERSVVRREFDAAYYLAMNPELGQARADPLEHFLARGWREGRDPSPDFSVNDYLELYPDIAASGMNPFHHYLVAGRAEGRAPKRDLGFRHDIIQSLRSLDERLEQARAHPVGAKADPIQGLKAALAGPGRSGFRRLHVSTSHDDYARNVGGVQLCLQREAAALAELGVDHVHLFPARAWLTALQVDADPLLGVLVNEVLVGHFPAKAIAAAVRESIGPQSASAERSFAVHSLLGHASGAVADILEAFGLREGYFWVHDFASVCIGFNLLRNDVEFCGAPAIESPACTICVYGEGRAAQMRAHAHLFERLRLTVVAPSRAALETWRRGVDFPRAAERVHPHARLAARGEPAAPPRKGPLRVAFLGMPTPHKGWPVFKDLAFRFAKDGRYDFLHLGKEPARGAPVRFREVSATAERPDAMQAAIEAEAVDVAVIWSICNETFCFAAYEAVAGGAAILTNPDSGNVAAFVAETEVGVVVREKALSELFETGAIERFARAVRQPTLSELVYSRMTVDLIEPEAVR